MQGNNHNHTDENETNTQELSEQPTVTHIDEDSSAESSSDDLDKKEDMDAELIAEGYEPYQPKLTEKQRKIIETIAGLLAGFLIWLALGLSSADQENTLLRWLFLIIFVGVMIAKRQIEQRTGLTLKTFMKFFLIGLVVFLGVFLLYGLTTGLL